MKKYALLALTAAFGLLSIGLPVTTFQTAHAQENTIKNFVPPTVFQAAGPNVASIQSSVDAFRAALGNPNNGNAGSLTTGHREINWDGAGGVDTTTTAPVTPFNVFLNTRGSQFTTPGTGLSQAPPSGGAQGGLAVLFNNPSYATIFKPFSNFRLFTPVGSNITDALFFVPGSGGNTPATVSGFGAVFTDVDQPDGSGPGEKRGNRGASTLVEFFGVNGELLFSSFVPASPGDGNQSFFGVKFNDSRIARVRITTGDVAPGPDDDSKNDIVMMDDFIYGEPQPLPPNANDDTDAFVRQQYRDFLNREADPAGLAFWSGEINYCTPEPQCTDVKRINASAAFFLSIEFQTTGNLVRSFYVAALDRPLTNNMPAFIEFERDTQAVQSGVIVGQGDWEQTLNKNRDAFMREFVTRAEFVGLYPTTDTPTQYVDKLYLHAGITPTSSERGDTIAEFGTATTAADAGARGRALLDVTGNAAFQQREINRSFVQMQYFGYLRRNPNDAPDGNFAGFDFWLDKLNAAGGNFITSEMVKSFLVSFEYRERFRS